jgi:SAM-dependent methyltransferase
MTLENIYRGVWGLGPSNTGYPGAFPSGLINAVRRRWWGKRRLWLFSGTFRDHDGVTVDIKREVKPAVQANCEKLPFKDARFDFVFLDPPYSAEEAMALYKLPYINLLSVLNEAARVCETGGHVLLLHRIVPQCHPEGSPELRKMQLEAIVGVYTISGWSNMRALTVLRKRNDLRPFCGLS